jgi:hypothetical protein
LFPSNRKAEEIQPAHFPEITPQFPEIYPGTVAPDSATSFLHTPLKFQKELEMYCHMLPYIATS